MLQSTFKAVKFWMCGEAGQIYEIKKAGPCSVCKVKLMGFVGELDDHLEYTTHFSEHVMDACNLCYIQIQLQWQVGRCARDGSEDVEQQSHDESNSDSEWKIGLSQDLEDDRKDEEGGKRKGT